MFSSLFVPFYRAERGKKREIEREREMTNGTNGRTSKNLQRRADVSRSIVKEQSSHASKDPRRKERGERTIAFSRRSNQWHQRVEGGCFSKGRLYVTPAKDSQYSFLPVSPLRSLSPLAVRLIYFLPVSLSLFLSLMN